MSESELEKDATTKFADYPFRSSILQDIETAAFVSPTPIQAAFFGLALAGQDLIGVAQTGTGKTAAFALPVIERMAQRPQMGALVLSPTRELARQTADMFGQLGRSSGIHVATIMGGVPHEQDQKALAMWPNVLVATPGRLIDHIQSRTIDLREIEILVVDEADRMHDMGFIPQVRRILDALPGARQTLMLTATMPSDIELIARNCMKNAVRIQVGRRSTPPKQAQQDLFLVESGEKDPLLLSLLKQSVGRVLIFVSTKRAVNRLARVVSLRCSSVTELHSDRTQEQRDAAMSGFREGKYRILVATDIAARGLDIANVEHVINYDFPQSAEDYVHRVGRTARASATGKASSFVSDSERRQLSAVERLIGAQLTFTPVPHSARRAPRPPTRRRAAGLTIRL